MRFKSNKVSGYRVYAVTGANVASFAINASDADTKDLLGFSIYRVDPKENQEYWVYTEFNRLFHHYYFRSVWEEVNAGTNKPSDEDSLFLKENDSWLEKYKPGKFRAKRVKMFVEMQGISASL